MSYFISGEMLDTFINSVRLNKQYARLMIECTKEEKLINYHKEAIKNMDFLIDLLEEIKENGGI